MNIDNVVGSIGFMSRIIPSVYPISVIKADPNTGEPIRDSNGLCQVNVPFARQQHHSEFDFFHIELSFPFAAV